MLVFVTGANKIPPLGFGKTTVDILFFTEKKDVLPLVSTCGPSQGRRSASGCGPVNYYS